MHHYIYTRTNVQEDYYGTDIWNFERYDLNTYYSKYEQALTILELYEENNPDDMFIVISFPKFVKPPKTFIGEFN